MLNLRVQYGDQKKKLVLVVVGGDGPSLLERNWLKYIRLDWSSIFAVRMARIKPKSPGTLFRRIGTDPTHTATLQIRPEATPCFLKPRPVPFAIKDAISQELDNLEHQSIITPVAHSEWAAPIMAIPKGMESFASVETLK